jgi:phosphatidylinositol glycan class S
MAAGGATSYSEVAAVRARAALDRSFAAALPPAWGAAPLCDEWEARLGACARTWARPHAADALMDLVPLGSVKSGWNFTPDGGAHKRVLGAAVEVSDEDNVKQDISIDVYGRGDHADAVDGGLPVVKDDADADGAPAVAPVTVGKVKVAKVGAKAAAADDDDDLDALLGL